MRPRAVTASLLAAATILAACGGAAPTEAAGGDGSGVPTVGMALAGPKNDKGFAQAHYEGLVAAEEELGVTVSVMENVLDPQERVEALRTLAQDNELVIGVGAEYAEAGTVVAPQFPDVTFMIINGEDSDAENLHVYGVREGVPAYIAGVVAAEISESGAAGFVGGEEIPPLFQALTGFEAGLRSVNGDATVSDTIVGSFVDPQGAHAAAASQIASGADVIYSYVDSGIVGVVEAINDSGKDVATFGIIYPRCDEDASIVGTSVVNATENVKAMVADYINGNLPDEPLFRGIENPDILRFELCPEWDRPELRKIVEDTTKAINDGTIELPEGI